MSDIKINIERTVTTKTRYTMAEDQVKAACLQWLATHHNVVLSYGTADVEFDVSSQGMFREAIITSQTLETSHAV